MDKPIELYELKTDPGESKDVAAANADLVKKAEAMMKQAKVGEPVVIFYKTDGNSVQSECYTNNFFFQFNGDLNPKSQWSFTHIEVRMNRTFNGSTPALLGILKDVIAGKAQPPPPDKDIPRISRSELMVAG